jgi:hypothetical protein
MISIFAHYLEKDGVCRSHLLGFKRVLGARTGENQAALIVAILREYDIDGKTRYFVARRLRCLGHVVNLCARAMLISNESGRTLRKLESAAEEEVEDMWRARGPIGKLHNINRYIRWTPQRREQFANIRVRGSLAQFDELEASQI